MAYGFTLEGHNSTLSTPTTPTAEMTSISSNKYAAPYSKLKLAPANESLISIYTKYSTLQLNTFGHIGDQNMHLNVLLTWRGGADDVHRGAIEGEHGVRSWEEDIYEYKQVVKVSVIQCIYDKYAVIYKCPAY